MKKVFILLIIMICFFAFSSTIKAEDAMHGFSQYYYNDCVENHTCMLLCGYTNKVQYRKEKNGIDAAYNNYSSYIYYDFNRSNFFVEWLSQETDINIAKHTKKLEKKLVFLEDYDKIKENGECPNYSFIDTGGISSEVCYSYNNDYCINSNNIGTKFQGDSTLEYNYQTHIKTYYKDWNPVNEITCERLLNPNENFQKNYEKDFSTNFLYGNAIPDFIKNSQAYKDGTNIVGKKITVIKKDCINQAKIDLKSEKITEDDYNDLISKYEAGAAYYEKAKDEAEKTIDEGTKNNNSNHTIPNHNCTSLLGDPNQGPDNPSPAYLLTYAFKVIRYVALIILVIASIMDFVSAVSSQDKDSLNKAVNKTIQRTIICIIIFLLPSIIQFVLTLLNDRAVNICINY